MWIRFPEYRRQDQQHYGKHPCHYLERYAGKQEDGHHQNAEQHWENQQTREVFLKQRTARSILYVGTTV